MNVDEKIKELKNAIDALSKEERATKGRIEELKKLINEKKRREETLANVKAEEAACLKELGLV